MTAIASLDALINNLTGGGAVVPDHKWFWVDARIQAAAANAPVAGRFMSLWQNNKSNGANGGAVPAAASSVAPTNSTIGALPYTQPTGGRQKWMLGIESGLAAAGILMVYDRLAHGGGLVSATVTAQTLTGCAVSRYTGAAADGNQIWLEYAGVAQAVATHALTVTYTNQAGTAGQVSKSVVTGTVALQGMIPIPLADGDTGVQSVQSVTVSVAGTASSTFSVVIMRPLSMNIGAGGAGGSVRDLIAGLPTMPEVLTGACLAFAWYANTTTAFTGFIGVHLAES